MNSVPTDRASPAGVDQFSLQHRMQVERAVVLRLG